MLEHVVPLQILDVLPDGRLGAIVLLHVLLQPLHHHLVVVPEVALGRAAPYEVGILLPAQSEPLLSAVASGFFLPPMTKLGNGIFLLSPTHTAQHGIAHSPTPM